MNGVGDTDADLMVVGEAPGANEDEQGEPFVGRSGDVLTEKLEEVGLSRSDVRISNCVRCRPPENRDPTKEERANCFGYLVAEIEYVEPDVIVTLGSVPGEALTGRDSIAVTKEAGGVVQREFGDHTADVLIGIHPAATLYNSSYESILDDVLTTAVERIE